ncbi:MAG: oligosaccharide flippase family protein [Candidatus Acidiferrum sp.]
MKRILQNLASVVGGETILRVANLAAAIAIARLYGPAVLGLYGACTALVTVVFMFADGGLQLSAITEIGSARERAPWLVGEFYLSKSILCATAVGFLFAIGIRKGFPNIYWVIGGFITLRTLIQSYSQLQIAILKSFVTMHLIGIIQAFHSAVLILGIAVAYVQNWSIVGLLKLLVLGQALELFLMTGAVLRIRVRPCWPLFSSCLGLMRRSVLLGLGYALANLIVRLDVVVLSFVVSLPELGQFSAADNLLVVAYLASWLFGSVLLPEMVELSNSPEVLDRFLNRWIRIAYKITVPGALVVFLIAPRAITMLYGSDFAHAGALASWIFGACPFIVFNSLSLHYTIAIGAKRTYLKTMLFTALSATALNYSLAHYFGAAGVAAAILIRESLLSVVLWLRHSRTKAADVEIGISVSSRGYP